MHHRDTEGTEDSFLFLEAVTPVRKDQLASVLSVSLW
jgi:hypothetical protein